MNYGSIGTIVGHEMTHSIDYMEMKSAGDHSHDHGHDHDHDNFVDDKEENNKKPNWRWTEEAREEFASRAQCMVGQYGEVVHEQIEEMLDGSRTLMENIADNGGLKDAYGAFQLNQKRGKADVSSNQLLPGLNFTPEQLFFVSHARVSFFSSLICIFNLIFILSTNFAVYFAFFALLDLVRGELSLGCPSQLAH